jgi:hypothetical protein
VGGTIYSATPDRARLTGAGALVLAFLVTLTGAAYDLATGSGLRRAFAVALVIGAVLAAMLVRTRALYVVVIAPPLIYMAVSVLDSIIEPTGAFQSKAKLMALLANWLVYGFPEMAAATGLATLIAGLRLVGRRWPPT